MKIGIYTNLKKDLNAEAAKYLISILNNKNVDYLVCENAKEAFENEKLVTFEELSNVDIIVAFGGDGTMLKVVSLLNGKQVPILGVNLGKIGFLTEIAKDQLESAVDSLLLKKYTIEPRTLLQAFCDDHCYYSLNEILLSNASNAHIAVVAINIDDSYAATVRGDGVMVSTPTGSTAYSLACNGPILSPNVKAIIVNTVCPHSLHSVPMVVGDDSEIVLSSKNADMRLVVDGRIKEEFSTSSKVVVKKAKAQALFVRFENENFYQKLLQKLSYWGD